MKRQPRLGRVPGSHRGSRICLTCCRRRAMINKGVSYRVTSVCGSFIRWMQMPRITLYTTSRFVFLANGDAIDTSQAHTVLGLCMLACPCVCVGACLLVYFLVACVLSVGVCECARIGL